jgi:hypothetical protein
LELSNRKEESLVGIQKDIRSVSKTCQWGCRPRCSLFPPPLEGWNLHLIDWKTCHSSFIPSNMVIPLSEDGCIHVVALRFSREDQTGTFSIQVAAWDGASPPLHQFWNPVLLLCLCKPCLLHLNNCSSPPCLLCWWAGQGGGGWWRPCWCLCRWDALRRRSARHLHRHCLPPLGSGVEHRRL